MEERKISRLSVIEHAIARINGKEGVFGNISDINPCGLSMQYQANGQSVSHHGQIDLCLEKGDFCISGIPCDVVYDKKIPPNGKQNCRVCGLRFGEMDDEQKARLHHFLCDYTTDDGKERRFGDIVIEKFSIARAFYLPFLVDFFLLTISLLSVHYLKRQTFDVSTNYIALFAIFYLSWWSISVAMEKYHRIFQKSYFDGLSVLLKSSIVLLYLVSIIVVVSDSLSTVSRVQTFGTCLAYFLIETTLYSLYAMIRKDRFRRIQKNNPTDKSDENKASIILMIFDALLLLTAFFIANYIKRGSMIFPPSYDKALLLVYTVWGLSIIYAKKFNYSIFNASFLSAFNYCLRAAMIMVASLGVIIFSVRLHNYSRLQLFSVPVILLVLELGLYYLYWLYRHQGRIGKDVETITDAKAAMQASDTIFDLPTICHCPKVVEPVETKLKHALGFFDPKLYDFISNTINLEAIDRCKSAMMSTADISELEALANNRHQLFVNLHKTNDVRWFNRYFLQVYRKLENQGYFIGKAHTITTHKQYYDKKYPKIISRIFYTINFFWCRVCPKLPVLQKLYFAITSGRNRMVSKAEIFGRLYFCGFKIVDDMEIDNRLYFIARKVRMPAFQTNPTYGPLVKLKRIGFNGELITVFKFRTMFPYSEFLQEYIYEKNSIEEGGKFKNDFRVTGWGKFMRATWLDELPMLYNWLKGDMKLFGVRPLSRQYLGLYTDELRNLRKKVLPGLIPPFYADMPKTLPEIIESEQNYIESYLHAPIQTQLKYLWRSSINILIKGARSG